MRKSCASCAAMHRYVHTGTALLPINVLRPTKNKAHLGSLPCWTSARLTAGRTHSSARQERWQQARNLRCHKHPLAWRPGAWLQGRSRCMRHHRNPAARGTPLQEQQPAVAARAVADTAAEAHSSEHHKGGTRHTADLCRSPDECSTPGRQALLLKALAPKPKTCSSKQDSTRHRIARGTPPRGQGYL